MGTTDRDPVPLLEALRVRVLLRDAVGLSLCDGVGERERSTVGEGLQDMVAEDVGVGVGQAGG